MNIDYLVENSDIFYIWASNIGFFMILLGILFANQDKLENIKEHVKLPPRQYPLPAVLKQMAGRLAEISAIKYFIPPKGSKAYTDKERLLASTGGTIPLTVEEFFAVKIALVFIFLLFAGILVLIKIAPALFIAFANIVTGNIGAVTRTAGLLPKMTGLSVRIIKSCIPVLLLYSLPDYAISYIARKTRRKFMEEVNMLQNCLILLMEAKTIPVYDMLRALIPISNYLKPHLIACVNEYNINPEKAIYTLSSKIGTKEFDVLARAMVLMAKSEKANTVMITESILQHYKRMKYVKLEEKIKKKPVLMSILMGLPLTAFLIVWLMPWLYSFFQVLNSGFNF